MSADTPPSTGSAPAKCRECDSALLSPMACGSCNAIFPVGEGTSHFDRLGIPESFTVDLTRARSAFLKLTRDLHPDFYMDRPEDERALSVEHSAQLNEAWSVVQEPFRRAAYLVDRWAPQNDAERINTMPTGFLEAMLMLREEIDELGEGPPTAEHDALLGELREQLQEKRNKLIASLESAFADLERAKADGTDAAAPAAEIRAVLNASRYITNALEAVRNIED